MAGAFFLRPRFFAAGFLAAAFFVTGSLTAHQDLKAPVAHLLDFADPALAVHRNQIVLAVRTVRSGLNLVHRLVSDDFERLSGFEILGQPVSRLLVAADRVSRVGLTPARANHDVHDVLVLHEIRLSRLVDLDPAALFQFCHLFVLLGFMICPVIIRPGGAVPGDALSGVST